VIRLALASVLLLAAAGAARADPPAFEPAPVVQKGNRTVPDLDKINAPELHFTLLKQGKRNVLYVWGHIDSGDSGRFQQALDAAKPIEELWFFSGGGDLEEGLEIGRMVHKAHQTTHILSWMQCISACNFMFMGGTVRTIDPGGEFSVHMFANNVAMKLLGDVADPPTNFEDYNDANPERRLTQKDYVEYKTEHEFAKDLDLASFIKLMVVDNYVKFIQQDSAKTAAEIARFLTEMSLSLRFLTAFANIPNITPRVLTRDELRDFNIVNGN